MAQPIVDNSEDPQLEKERIAAAVTYSRIFGVDIENAYMNLDNFHQQWTGQNFVKKSGLKALGDSLLLNVVSSDYNKLCNDLSKRPDDPILLKAVEEKEREVERLRDHAPKVWQDDYVKMGGWHDVGQFARSLGVTLAENAGAITAGIGAAAVAATGVGAIAEAAGLSAFGSGLLVAGASKAAIGVSTYNSTNGIKYRAMRNEGIPHDIALQFSRQEAIIEGAIEGALGGVEGAAAKVAVKAVLPEVAARTINKSFVSGKMGVAVRKTLEVLKQGAEEGSEELLQGLSGGKIFNDAADEANRVREKKLRDIMAPQFEGIREEALKRLEEEHPEVAKKEWGNIIDEALEGAIAGFLTGVVLGVPVEIAGAKADVRSSMALSDMARNSPTEAAFKENYKQAKEAGLDISVTEGMKTDEVDNLLTDVYKSQQARLTPEQKEEIRKAHATEESIAEVTDFRNVEIEEYQDEEGETKTRLTTPDTEVYKENDRLAIEEYTDTNEDGSINGAFVAGDTRVNDEAGSGINQYGYINYTEKEDSVTIDDFKMHSGREGLRQQLFDQFAEKFAGKNIVWNPQHEENIAIKDQLINNNQRGPKEGLNYHEKGADPKVSQEARQVAERFRPHMKNSSSLEVALAADVFNSFYRRRGESLNGAMNRLIGKVTNEAPKSVIAAQREGATVKGATWLEQTAEGMKRIVYLSKTAADASTVIHETSHAVAMDFTPAERNIAARALDGYQLKNGDTVYFEENTEWTDEQHEAFAEALENYLTNGTAPNEEVKGIFEKIKEFMKKIYRTMKGWTELSPKVEEFYKSLLSGELVDQARAEAQTHEEARSKAQSEKTQNDTTKDGETENERRVAIAREKWEAADRILGDEDQITLQTGEEMKGHYELGEAGISTPSVDPDANFTQSEGFPVNPNGTSMNVGRDYTEGFSREATHRIAADFDQRGMGIVVDSNGVTSSGNNRDISRRIAAKNGTDTKYVEYIKSRPERWGFTQEDVAKYKHPTVYFVVSAPTTYTPMYFDQFNRSGEKSVSPLETAIKMSYLIDKNMINEFSAIMGNYESINDLYEDAKAASGIFKSLMKKGIVTENSYPDYVEAIDIRGKRQERVTSSGKDFLESVMLGAVLEEDSIRSLALVPEIRKRVVKGLAPMVDNAALGEYSVIPEINQAVAIAVEVQTNKKKYKSIEDYKNQSEFDMGQRVSTDTEVELAGRLLEKTMYGFADTMVGLNTVLSEEGRGQGDMFSGTSKDDILRRYLGVKAKRVANEQIINDPNMPMEAKATAVMDAAGEVLYQTGEEIPQEEQRRRVNLVLDSSPILVDTKAIPFTGDTKQLRKDAITYGKTILGKYTNKSDNELFELTQKNKHGGLKEVMSHNLHDINHLQSIAAIPTISTESQFITSSKNEHPERHPGISEFRYYLSKIAFQEEGSGSKEFIVKSVVSIAEDGKRYYDHRLTELEKVRGFVSSLVMQQETGSETTPHTLKDNRLQRILQEVFSEKRALFQTGRAEKTQGENFKNWFGDWENDPANASKVVDENGKPLIVYHGTRRPDRVGNKFDPKKATSGPMAFFTTSGDIASNYATNKADTSLAYESEELYAYDNWFRMKVGRGKPVPLSTAWYSIPAEQREKISKLAPRVTMEDDKIYLAEEGHTNGIGNYDWEIKQKRGNAAAALIEGWLTSGSLYNEERRFFDVLKLAGFDDNIGYYDPDATLPAVYPVYLNIKKPFDTSEISTEIISTLKEASKKARAKRTGNADMWDKNSIEPKEWVERLEEDLENNTTYSWTSIPDWVTKTLKGLGFDGIKDKGGKYSGADHTVWIPFTSNQIKSQFNKGTFSTENNNILFQIGDVDLMEEAAKYEDGASFRKYIEENYDTPPQGIEPDFFWSEDQINAWYDTYVEKAKQAVESSEELPDWVTEKVKDNATPAEVDKEFNQMIGEGKNLEEFIEVAIQISKEDGRYGTVDQSVIETADEIRRMMSNPLWEMTFKAGKIPSDTHRKKLLTLVRRAPREYRALYSKVMEDDYYSVSEEDRAAEPLKYKITDSRRKEAENMNPEQLRQLAKDIGREEFAEKVRTGKAKYSEPGEKEYIKDIQEREKAAEEKLKKLEEDRQEDNDYILKRTNKYFLKAYEDALKAKEQLTRSSQKLENDVSRGERAKARAEMRTKQANANYHQIIKSLEDMADAYELKLDVQKLIAGEQIKDLQKSAKAEARMAAALARMTERAQMTEHLNRIRREREAQKQLTKAKVKTEKRIFRRVGKDINAEQAIAIVNIQRLAEPQSWKEIDRFIGAAEDPSLIETFNRWKTDEKLRGDVLRKRHPSTVEKITRLFEKEKFEDLTPAEQNYLAKKLTPGSWATTMELEEIRKQRDAQFPFDSEKGVELARKYLPDDVFYRIKDKPISEWTLNERSELAKIIDDITVQGKELRKAQIDAEHRRIEAYRNDIKKTIKTVIKKGVQLDPGDEEAKKIVNKYNEGAGGTEYSIARKRKFKGPFFRYGDMDIIRFARMLDNGDANGKNSAILYRRSQDAYNQEMAAVDARTERITKLMKDLEITESELWQKSAEIDLGEDLGVTPYTASELLGFKMASRDEYSQKAVMYGNMLSEAERGDFQDMATMAEPLELIAKERFEMVKKAADKLIAENPKYQKLMDAIDQDFTAGGQRLNQAMIQYNNTYMPMVENYFPIHRQDAVSARTNDAKLAKDLMGASSGGFSLFVDKGFTRARQDIPKQYQTAIRLDMMGVWAEAVSKEEHFMAYGQLVKDLNGIYKQNRSVRDTIKRRYGKDAVEKLDWYINKMANPNPEQARTALDNFVRNIRGNIASAYLGWNVTSIVKQGITSPAPFFGHGVNPIEFAGTQLEFITHKEELWDFICDLSPHMKHRSMSLMSEMVKEQAKQRFDGKAENVVNKFNKKGMEGLEWIDRTCVAPGWLVLFRKELKKLTDDPANDNMSERDLQVKAAQHADDITILVQPHSRSEFVASMFDNKSELAKSFLQFTQSLNVVWQHYRYDVPQMIRDKQTTQAVRTIIGYTVASIIVGAVFEGWDSDDDDALKAKKVLWWSTMQFTDAFPMVGSGMTRLAEGLITGESRYQSPSDMIPAVSKTFDAGRMVGKAVHHQDFDALVKAIAAASEAAFLAKGLPVSAGKKYLGAAGFGDGDGKPGLNPEAVFPGLAAFKEGR